jgi:hypothetical protein
MIRPILTIKSTRAIPWAGTISRWRLSMKYVALSALLLFGMTACGGPATVGPNGGLRYGVPTTPSVTYVTESSQEIGIDAGAMGTMNMTASSEATLGVTFAAAANGVEVTTTFDEITASMTQPMGGSLSATESDVEGPLVFSMDAKGKGTPITIPSTKGSAEQLIAPVSFVHDFFPRLPGRAVDPGATWTDTISWEFSTAEGDQSTVSVLSYTLVGDTIVAGTSLLNITYVGDMDVVGSGTTEGTEVMQVFSGETTGMFLWDPARGLMVGGKSSADMEGTVEIMGAGMPPMPMWVTASSSVRIQGG